MRPKIKLSILGLVMSLSMIAMANGKTKTDAIQAAIHRLTKTNPQNPMQKNPKLLVRMSNAIATTADTYSIPPMILVTIIYKESSFRSDAKGKARSEIGLMQVHGRAAKGCDLSTVEGQIDCGAAWFRYCYDLCGSYEGAFTAYAVGECTTENDRVKWKIGSRIRMWKTLESLFFG